MRVNAINAYGVSQKPTHRGPPRSNWPIDHASPVTGQRQRPVDELGQHTVPASCPDDPAALRGYGQDALPQYLALIHCRDEESFLKTLVVRRTL